MLLTIASLGYQFQQSVYGFDWHNPELKTQSIAFFPTLPDASTSAWRYAGLRRKLARGGR